MGYYFRGIDRHDEKLAAAAKAMTKLESGQGTSLGRELTNSDRNSRLSTRTGKAHKQSCRRVFSHKQRRSQCCGVPLHLVVLTCMAVGAVAVLGVFLALPLYVYLDKLPHMQC